MDTSFPACMYVCAGTYPAKSRFNVSVDTIPPAQSNLSSTSHIRPTGNYPPQPVLCVQWHRPKSSASYVLHRSASAFSRPANCAIDAARLYIKALGSAREIRSDTPGPISWFSLSLIRRLLHSMHSGSISKRICASFSYRQPRYIPRERYR